MGPKFVTELATELHPPTGPEIAKSISGLPEAVTGASFDIRIPRV